MSSRYFQFTKQILESVTPTALTVTLFHYCKSMRHHNCLSNLVQTPIITQFPLISQFCFGTRFPIQFLSALISLPHIIGC